MVSVRDRVIKALRTLTRREVIDQVRAVAQPIAMVVVAYVGFLNNSPQVTMAALLGLFFYTAYALSWYISRSVELRNTPMNIQVRVMHRGDLLRINVPEGVRVKPIVSRHVEPRGNELVLRWSGVARLLGFLLTSYDSLTGLTISTFRKLKLTILILPEPLEGGGVTSSTSLESGSDEYRGLIEYDYTKPASRIHWLASVRVNSLVAKDYSEETTRLIVAVPALPDLLAEGAVRPIDRVLMVLEELAMRYGLIRVNLIGPGLSRSINVTASEVPLVEGELVDAYSWAADEGEVERLRRLVNVTKEEATWVTYPRPKPSEEGWSYFTVNATGHVAIIPSEKSDYAAQLRRRGIEVLVV